MPQAEPQLPFPKPRAKIIGRGRLPSIARKRPLAPRDEPALRPESLRRCAWDVGARWQVGSVPESGSHVTLAAVNPTTLFSTWHVDPAWIDARAAERGYAWHDARLVLRIYDVTCIDFDGFNAHAVRDVDLHDHRGETFAHVERGGTNHLAEVGFLLRSREFVPAARSVTVGLPSGACSHRTSLQSLFCDQALAPEPVDTPWEGPAYVEQRDRPHLREGLRIAVLAFESTPTGHQSALGTFVTELAGQLATSHDVHVFVPSGEPGDGDFEHEGVTYHRLGCVDTSDPVRASWHFVRCAEAHMVRHGPFDLVHLHEWMTAVAPQSGHVPTVLSLTSLECVRRNGAEADEVSREVEKHEVEAARAADVVLVPGWLRDTALDVLGLEAGRVVPFDMEGRPESIWDREQDFGRVKGSFGLGPFDRLVTFVGPLIPEAGVDLLVEALPASLSRTPCARVVLVGEGWMRDALWNRAHQLGVAHALRTPGHVGLEGLAALLRASEALALPSRGRVEGDEHVAGLARLAGIPLIVTHTGPSHCASHEQTGLVTYDNPGSIVWALDRILGAPDHAGQMGLRGRVHQPGPPHWSRVARIFSDLCAERFAGLALTQSHAAST